MNKLHRTIEGQSLQFVTLPKIFQRLNSDLPSGAIKLPNGEVAYYRIVRNHAELNKRRRDMNSVVQALVDGLKSMVSSQAFLNQYGLTEVPNVDFSHKLNANIRTMLLTSTNVVEYRSTQRGNEKGLLEQITVNLGNMVVFTAQRGKDLREPENAGITGTLLLGRYNDEIEGKPSNNFRFSVASPFIDLGKVMGAEALGNEILTKLRTQLKVLSPLMALEFDDGVFNDYSKAALASLDTKKRNTKRADKKTSALPGVAGLDYILTDEEFRALSLEARAEYLKNIPNTTADLQRRFLESDVLSIEYNQHSTNTSLKKPVLTRQYFLARKVGLKDPVVRELVGEGVAKHVSNPANVADAQEPDPSFFVTSEFDRVVLAGDQQTRTNQLRDPETKITVGRWNHLSEGDRATYLAAQSAAKAAREASGNTEEEAPVVVDEGTWIQSNRDGAGPKLCVTRAQIEDPTVTLTYDELSIVPPKFQKLYGFIRQAYAKVKALTEEQLLDPKLILSDEEFRWLDDKATYLLRKLNVVNSTDLSDSEKQEIITAFLNSGIMEEEYDQRMVLNEAPNTTHAQWLAERIGLSAEFFSACIKTPEETKRDSQELITHFGDFSNWDEAFAEIKTDQPGDTVIVEGVHHTRVEEGWAVTTELNEAIAAADAEDEQRALAEKINAPSQEARRVTFEHVGKED
jgi:hypothetical protein